MTDNPLTTWLASAGPAPARDAPEIPPPPPREQPAARTAGAPPEGADGGGGRASSRRLWRLAALPWAVALLLALALATSGRWASVVGEGGRDQAAAEVRESGDAPALPADAADGQRPETPALEDGVSAPPGAAMSASTGIDPDLAAAASVATRLALTERGADGDRYVDLVVADGVSWHDDVAVVTLALVILEGRDGSWERTRPARYAIALRRGPDGALDALGPPWPVTGAPAVPTTPEGTADPIDDADLRAAVADAVERAGYRDVVLEGVLPSPTPSVRLVRLRAVGPGDAAPRGHDLLLDADPPHHVLGTP